MPNIYREQVDTTTNNVTAEIGRNSPGDIAQESAKTFQKLEQDFAKKAEQHQKLAGKLYTDGSKIAIHNGLEELSRNEELATNPEEFAKQADKMAQDVFGQIQDPSIKEQVVLNYELAKTPYVNNAYRNYYKKQRQEQQAQTMGQLDGYFDSLAISFGNLLNDTGSVDDFLSVRNATQGIDEALNQKDLQGYDVLTPSEKRIIQNKRNKLLQNAVIGAINDASYAQQMQIINDISEDKFALIKDLQESLGNKQVQMGGLENYLTPESVDYVKKYARGVKERYEKLSKKNLSDTDALSKAHVQTIYDLELPAELKEIKKMEDGDDKTFAFLDGRLRAEDLLRSGDIDEKTYQKYIEDSTVPLIDGIEEVEGATSHWFRPNGAFEDGTNVLQALSDVPKEKAYLYQGLYKDMREADIDPDSSNMSDKERVKELAVARKQDFLEKKNANLIGTEVNRVLLGRDTLETYKQPKEPKPATNLPWRMWQGEDGQTYKILPDKNGNYTNDSVAIPMGNTELSDTGKLMLNVFSRMLPGKGRKVK